MLRNYPKSAIQESKCNIVTAVSHLSLRYPIVRLGYVLEQPRSGISFDDTKNFGANIVENSQKHVESLKNCLESAGGCDVLFDANETLRDEDRPTVVLSFPRAAVALGDYLLDVRVCITVCADGRSPKIWCRANLSNDGTDNLDPEQVSKFFEVTSNYCRSVLNSLVEYYQAEFASFLDRELDFSILGKIRFRSFDVSESELALQSKKFLADSKYLDAKDDPSLVRLDYADTFLRKNILASDDSAERSLLEFDASGLPWSMFSVQVSEDDCAEFVGLCCGTVNPDDEVSTTVADRTGKATKYFGSTSHKLTLRLANLYGEKF